MENNKTIRYYNSNAKDFASGTVSVDFEVIQKKFTGRLLEKSVILDFGCGSGRDTKYFISQGYQVDAMDGSIELCRLASKYTGIEVKNIFFNELAQVEKYDGIWACSSILHLPFKELAEVMRKMVTALKDNGIIYASFKYGTFAGERNGRYFTDMTEDTFADFIKQIENVRIEELWITSDVRPKRGEEKWLNVIDIIISFLMESGIRMLLNDKECSFHPKAYMFHYENASEIYIGSSNISRSALTSGIEWNYRRRYEKE